jgi:D-alanyl-D-alanine carboxypeptidase
MGSHMDKRTFSVLVIVVLTLTACTSPDTAGTTTTALTSTTAAVSATTAPVTPVTSVAPAATNANGTTDAGTHTLGKFPEFPSGSLSESTTATLQQVLDAAVEVGTFVGVTAAVILVDRGSWTGAAGSWDDVPLTPDSRHPTHSAGKTFVAAEVLRLVEDGMLDLDDRAADHLPVELGFFDANGATIRQVLAMRSGIPDLNEDAGYYPAEQAPTAVEVFRALPEPTISPGAVTRYASTNFVLLGTIIEHATGQPLSEALRSDVLSHPGLDGIVYTVNDALASDGWGVETTSASLARWGYELYGGFVISDESLREMTDFHGEWYGLGVMDLSNEYGALAIGHQGLSSVTTCCSAIVLLALPAEGIVIAVQANTADTPGHVDTNRQVDLLAGALRKAVRG